MLRGAQHQEICRRTDRCVCGVNEMYAAWLQGRPLTNDDIAHHDMKLLRTTIAAIVGPATQRRAS